MFTIHHYNHPDAETAEHLRRMQRVLDHLLKEVNNMAIDTSKLLAEVEKAKTESASLRALVKANTQAMGDIKAQLADAVAKLQQTGADTAQLEQVQRDIDTAQQELSADNEETQALLDANTPADTSGAGQQGGVGTGSSGATQQDPSTQQPAPAQDPAQQQPQADQGSTAQPLAGTGQS